jgi:decaprenyl-phosphate phosphoribosyltransferase
VTEAATAAMGWHAKAMGLLQSIRPQQWVKNGFVLAPLVFARQLADLTLGLRGLAAFAVFCAVSGSVYLMNDLLDVDSDRRHPVKRHRPIASGRVSPSLAWAAFAALLVGGLSAAFAMSAAMGVVVLMYVGMNIAYSVKLKHLPFVDVAVIAAGFLLRLLAGAYAAEVSVSIWIVLCTFLLSLYLALGKRQHELRVIQPGEQRKVLAKYNRMHVQWAMAVVGALTVLAYSAYTFAPETQTRFGFEWPRFTLTVPFTAVGVLRFWKLAHDQGKLISPTEGMLKDRLFVLNVLAWCVAVVVLVYGL